MSTSLFSLCDMHVHVGFMADPVAFQNEVTKADAAVLSVSAVPQEYAHLQSLLGLPAKGVECGDVASGNASAVRVGLGLHPWWVPDNEAQLNRLLEEFDTFALNAFCIGEVGLDFSARREVTKDLQLQAFRHIAKKCASRKSDQPSQLISIHCVRAYDEMLAIMKEYELPGWSRCIFHWFSGSSQHLHAAIESGCFFSVSERMMTSKKGREYVKRIPENRLLLETDAPSVSNPEVVVPCEPYTYQELTDELNRTLQVLSNLRGVEPSLLAGVINKTAKSLLFFE